MQTLDVTFDGQVFRPDMQPTDLEPNTRLRIRIEPLLDQPQDAWDVLESLMGTVKAPSDWAENHDKYLTGTPGSPGSSHDTAEG